MQKPEVRRIAAEQGLITANKKDSQGLCFVGKIKLPDFLQQQLQPKEGAIVEIPKEDPIFVDYRYKVELIGTPNNIAALKTICTDFNFDAAQTNQKGHIMGLIISLLDNARGLM